MTSSKAVLLCCWPAVIQTARMVPLLSQTRLTLLVESPRERPKPWSAGSVKCVERSPDAPRKLLGDRGDSQTTCRGTVERCETAVVVHPSSFIDRRAKVGRKYPHTERT